MLALKGSLSPKKIRQEVDVQYNYTFSLFL